MKNSNSIGYLIISDKILEGDFLKNSVVYRPPSLVVGIGLHWDTSKEKIKEGLDFCLQKFKLSEKSIAKLVSIKKPEDVKGLVDIHLIRQIWSNHLRELLVYQRRLQLKCQVES